LETRNQPFSLESEHVVIGACLLESDGSVYDTCSQIVDASDFYLERHRILFETIGQLVSDGVEISTITLLEKLRSNGQEDHVGGYTAISAIQDSVETATHASFSAKVVKEASRKRGIIRTAREAVEACYEGETKSDDVVAKIESSIIHMSKDQCEDDTISKAAGEVEEDLKAMMAGTYDQQGLKFGIDSIDDHLMDGLVNGTVTVVAAPTSVGKSQAALNCSLKLGITDKLPCGYFSYEMLAKQLSKRMLQTASGVNLGKFRDQCATSSEQKAVHESLQKLKDSTILTNYSHKSVDSMASLARQWKRKHGIKILTIDYLQRMDSPNSKMGSVEAIAYNSKKIKDLALELEIPVLLLSQVNREAVKRLAFNPEGGLYTHDLIGASAIENDSDNILIFWPSEGDPEKSRKLDVNYKPYMSLRGQFAKYREGTRGVRFDIKFIEQTGRFK
jgi:replicative DNA helicase